MDKTARAGLCCNRRQSDAGRSANGFSVMELLVVVVITLITTAIAVPLVQNASTSYKMRGAVNSVTGAIQTARYQAISNGYPYRIDMSSAASTYQIWKNPCGAASTCWAQVGGPVPLSGSSVNVILNQDTSLLFHAGGRVDVSTGALNFSLTYNGLVENITVSIYGSISVNP